MSDEWDAPIPDGQQTVLPVWVCSRCGTTGAEAQAGFLQMDPRYATGYCDVCNPPNSDRKTPRPVQRLIRADVFDRAAWTMAKEKEELAGLVQEFGKYRGPTGTIKMADKDIIRLVYLYDKHGFAGFHLPVDARDAVAAHHKTAERRAQYTQKAKKRGR